MTLLWPCFRPWAAKITLPSFRLSTFICSPCELNKFIFSLLNWESLFATLWDTKMSLLSSMLSKSLYSPLEWQHFLTALCGAKISLKPSGMQKFLQAANISLQPFRLPKHFCSPLGLGCWNFFATLWTGHISVNPFVLPKFLHSPRGCQNFFTAFCAVKKTLQPLVLPKFL